MPELQVPADWYDMSMVSNRLRQTYVNGFLDVSNIFTARRDANIVGTIRQSEEGIYDAPSYVGTNVDTLTVNENFTLDPDCVFTFNSNDISNTGVFNNDGSFNNTGTFTNYGSMIVTSGTLYTDVSFVGTSDISVNSINASGGNVGIGTSNPEQKLHIRGNTDEYAVLAFEGVRSTGTEKTREGFIGVGATGGNFGTDMIFKLRNGYGAVTWDSGSQDVLYMNGNTTSFYTGNTERMTIVSTGNIGIATTNPTTRLDVRSNGSNISARFGHSGSASDSAQGDGIVHITGGNEHSQAMLRLGIPNTADGAHRAAIIAKYDSDSSSTAGNYSRCNLYFCVNDNNNTNASSENATIDHARMVIQRDGNVGIGITNPTYKTEIHTGALMDLASSSDKYTALRLHADRGGGNNNNDVGRGIRFEMSHSGRGVRMETRSHATYSNGVSCDFVNYCNGWRSTPTLTLEDCGNVGIGNSNPSYPLHVNGAVSNTYNIRYFRRTHGLQEHTSIVIGTSIYASSGIICNGLIGATSDRRIKKDIVEIDDDSALKQIRLLKPSIYKYIDDVSRDSGDILGFIAQEVKDVIPLAVKTSSGDIPNIMLLGSASIDASGNQIISIPDFDTSNLELDASGNFFSKLKVIIEDDNDIEKELFVEIQEIISQTQLRVVILDKNIGNLPAEVFIYGQEVDNKHILIKDRIFSVGISALQEVDRQLQAEKAKVATLETQLADVLARLAALESA